MNHDQKLELVERAVWDHVQKKDDNEVIFESNWIRQTTPEAPVVFLNGVYRCEIDDETIDQRISETIQHFNDRKLPFRWKIGPSSRPENLSERLTHHGLKHKDTLFGLFADPANIAIETNHNVIIKELTPEIFEDWLTVQSTAWNVPAQGIAHLRLKQSEVFKIGNKTHRDYIAYFESKPVACAGLRFCQGYAFLLGAAVNPECRRLGIYKTLLSHRLKLIQAAGLPAVVHCLENTSAPICLRLGFEKVCEIKSFEPAWPI